MNPNILKHNSFLGIDLGGTKIMALVANANGHVLSEALSATPPAGDPEQVVDAMVQTTQKAIQNAGLDLQDIQGVGIAAAGGIDPYRQVVVHSPNLPGWADVPLGQMFRRHVDLPTSISNDANLAALGEQRYGAGRGVSNLLFITVSTGIGGGIIINGRLYEGRSGYAGEVGHISVLTDGPYGRSQTQGAWEALASGTALAADAQRRLDAGESSSLQAQVLYQGLEGITAEMVFKALEQGDQLAQRVVEQGIGYLASGLLSLVNVLDPEKVIIGGGLSNQWQRYIGPAVAIMREQAFAGLGRDLAVEPPELGVRAGALGAVALAVDAAAELGR